MPPHFSLVVAAALTTKGNVGVKVAGWCAVTGR